MLHVNWNGMWGIKDSCLIRRINRQSSVDMEVAWFVRGHFHEGGGRTCWLKR